MVGVGKLEDVNEVKVNELSYLLRSVASESHPEARRCLSLKWYSAILGLAFMLL